MLPLVSGRSFLAAGNVGRGLEQGRAWEEELAPAGEPSKGRGLRVGPIWGVETSGVADHGRGLEAEPASAFVC